MKIINLLYLKYTLSLSISLVSSLFIFFIFSLIGNLNEKYLFSVIIKISFLNTLQIISYIPEFIFLLSVILLLVFLRSKNEIIIIKSYVSIKRLMLFFLPIVLIITLIEINKKQFSTYFEDTKTKLVAKSNIIKTKILVNQDKYSKTFKILENFNLDNLTDTEYRSYIVSDNKIKFAEYSNKILLSNNALIASNYTQYKNNSIRDYNYKKVINLDFNFLNKYNLPIKYINNTKNYEFDFKQINLLIFYLIFFHFSFFTFFNSRLVSTKQSLKKPIYLNLSILIYSFFIFNSSLNYLGREFEIIATIIVAILLLKVYLNE
ncbi:hypothetical protein OA513_01085 [Alphaproteobacteria bacterium]|nr:hypothetical protein [Alphaproteobacteria bacterium]|tara:strand:- start:1673 stop:2629 length:957 start_codon:yes stop_codon:yes gene_type:complete